MITPHGARIISQNDVKSKEIIGFFALFGSAFHYSPLLLRNNQFGAGGKTVGVGKIITVGGDDLTPLAGGAIVFGGDRRKSVALLDNVGSRSYLVVRISYFVIRRWYFVFRISYFGVGRYG